MNRILRPVGLLVIFVAVVGLLGLGGCGSGRPKRVKVSGVVRIDGKPVKCGFVRLVSKEHRAAWGEIGPDGRFTLTTFDDGDGAVLGTHHVEVVAYEKVGPNRYVSLVPERYRRAETSEVTVTIDGPTDSLVVDLTWGQERPTTVQGDSSGDGDPTAL